MVVFPEASKVYADWKENLQKKGVQIRLQTEVTRVISRSKKHGVQVGLKPHKGTQPTTITDKQNGQAVPDGEVIEEYDEIVFCVLADTAKRLLGKQARWIEKSVLGATQWADDVTVTHTVSILVFNSLTVLTNGFTRDVDYMKKWYELEFRDEVAENNLHGRDESHRVKKAKDIFKP